MIRHPRIRSLCGGLFIVLCGAMALHCGKRRPPLPPVERRPQRTELLAAVQRGNQIILTLPAPPLNAPADQSLQSVRRVDVYRLAEPGGAPQALTEAEFTSRATLVGSITEAEIRRARDFLVYADTLSFGANPARLRYAVRFVNASNQRAAFSNFVIVEPIARVSQPPTALSANESETAVRLTWAVPAANIDGSTPANILGYNLYRAAGPAEFTKLNAAPLPDAAYSDQNFVFNEQYRYLVRAVSLGSEAAPVESQASNIVSVQPRDQYPPAPPVRLTVAASKGGRISIFFPASLSPDTAGYFVYRSIDEKLPVDRWTQLNQQLLTRNTFVDDTAVIGQKYFYYVVAVDTFGNRSAPSIIVSETAF